MRLNSLVNYVTGWELFVVTCLSLKVMEIQHLRRPMLYMEVLISYTWWGGHVFV